MFLPSDHRDLVLPGGERADEEDLAAIAAIESEDARNLTHLVLHSVVVQIGYELECRCAIRWALDIIRNKKIDDKIKKENETETCCVVS